MHLNSCTYRVSDAAATKRKMLSWASRFNIFSFLDNQHYNIAPHQYEIILGAGALQEYHTEASINRAVKEGRFLMGHFNYEWNHALHGIKVQKNDPVGFPDGLLFEPEILLLQKNLDVEVRAANPGEIWQAILNTPEETDVQPSAVSISQRLSREDYVQIIRDIQDHLHRGDCYEINYCQEFFAQPAAIHPLSVFTALSNISPNPFAAFYRYHDHYLLCASPERFLSRKGSELISQPIKGTIRRNRENAAEDEMLREQLRNSAKDRAENVMVVDLVRNDLSMVCEDSSVHVKELFGLYAFPQVHQMISTVAGRARSDVSFTDIWRATFPMGSMTGAPKHRVMQLIDQYEPQKRGLFSGSVGYISHEGDFDFNVVIRSILYNAATQYLSYQAGSGITVYSDPELEWEECLLKAAAIKKVLALQPAPLNQ